MVWLNLTIFERIWAALFFSRRQSGFPTQNTHIWSNKKGALLAKKFCCPKTSRTKVFASVPSCDHWSSGAFCHNILWEEKSCLWKLHGGATRKSTFYEFFFAIQIYCQHFQKHAIRFGTFHKCYETQIIYMGRGLGWYLINEVMICQKGPKILKHFSVLKFWNTSVY